MSPVQQVQERAREEQEIREDAQGMGAVLRHDEEPGDGQKGQ